jgi:type IV secretion system protein TrbL
MAGVARTTISGPASRMAASAAAPVRTAYRSGAAQGYRDAAPSGDAGSDGPDAGGSTGGAPASSPPTWAQSLARRQRMTQAGMMAAHSLRDGDCAGSSSGPDLKNKT